MKSKHLYWPVGMLLSALIIAGTGCREHKQGGNIPVNEDSVSSPSRRPLHTRKISG